MKAFINILLWVLSKIGYAVVGVAGIVYGLFTRPQNSLKKFLKVAIVYDELVNVMAGELFCDTLGDGYGEVETISSRLGKNKRDGKQTKLGRWVSDRLNDIDPDHVEKSIE